MGRQERLDHLMKTHRPRWADELWPTLPCQAPEVDPDWWFEPGVGDEGRANREYARQLCWSCRMREPCREAGAKEWGMWGGVMR
jgi:hypothetical protein